MLKKTQKEGTLRKSEENGRSIHLSTIVNEHCENVDLLSISTNVKVSYLGTLLNIASGSEANMTTPCEMEFFNFLWLIWDHYIPLAPT